MHIIHLFDLKVNIPQQSYINHHKSAMLILMNITSATFARGVTNDENLIRDELPQIAFVGRSNVGKSSLINSLLGRRDLARSSSTPGFTKEASGT